MDDIVLTGAYIYALSVIAAVLYRFYGICARFFTRSAASRALRQFEQKNSLEKKDSSLDKVVKNILSDRIVSEEEFKNFAEISVFNYIDNKDILEKWISIHQGNKNEPEAALISLLSESFNSKSFRTSLMDAISKDTSNSHRDEFIFKFVMRSRFESYALELTGRNLNKNYDHERKIREIIDPVFLTKLASYKS
jgi:hypothetical protein